MRKRLLSIFIVLCLILSMVPAAFAVDSSGLQTHINGISEGGTSSLNSGDIFNAGGLRYRIVDADSKEVEVIHSSLDNHASQVPDSTYSGDVAVPTSVEYNDEMYSVIGIDTFAFYDADITSIQLSEGLEYIDGAAFAGSSLTSITIPSSVTRLGGGDNNTPVFASGNEPCSLTSIVFAEGSQLETLYSDPANGGPFRGCNSVNTIEIPASVTDLNLDEIAETQLSGQGFTGERFLGVFDGWTNAKNVTFAEGSQFDCEGGVIYDGEALIVSLDDEIESVIVRDGTSKIGDDAFFMCSKLKTVTLPDGLISIGDNAFNIAPNIDVILPSIPGLPQPQGSSQANILEQINVPATVTNIGDNFLKGALKTDGSSVVIMQGDTPPSFGEGAFATKDQAAQLKLYYPSEAEDAYTAEGSPLAEIINSSSDEDDSSYDYRLSLEDKQLGINDTIQFEVILPNGANLTVNSSDQSIATVSDSDGKITITGLSVGTTTISAKIELNGYEMVSDQCEVTVSPYIPPVPSYLITLPDLDNGTVTSDRATARQGATVTLTVTPEDGYTLDEISVTDFFGSRVDVSRNSDGTYSFVMPYSQVEVSATFVRTGEPIVFTDVPEGAYYYDPVYWAVANGITDGTSDTEFSPGRTVTRGEMVTFLWRAAGSPEPAATVNPFTDVDREDYYYTAVLWAVEQGITDGVSDTEFDPTGECTRAQMVTFLWRAAGQPDAGASNPFEDVSAEAYYYEAVLWAAENGVTDGTSDTQFSPEGDCTRAQAVTFLYRAR